MAHRGGVQAGVVALDGAGIERLVFAETGAQFVDDGVAVPLAVAADLVGVEAGGVKGAVPFAEKAGLK